MNVGIEMIKIDQSRTIAERMGITVTEYDEQLVRRLIEKISVYENKFSV